MIILHKLNNVTGMTKSTLAKLIVHTAVSRENTSNNNFITSASIRNFVIE
ncbi:MAG: hypothetical protein IPH11_10210 [Ignavibacteriales bacterium]|nr:hypothetical protein [Ignavibacteriales bacterium]